MISYQLVCYKCFLALHRAILYFKTVLCSAPLQKACFDKFHLQAQSFCQRFFCSDVGDTVNSSASIILKLYTCALSIKKGRCRSLRISMNPKSRKISYSSWKTLSDEEEESESELETNLNDREGCHLPPEEAVPNR